MKSPLHQIRWRLGFLALILCTILCSGCAQSNNEPVISSLEAEKHLVAPSSSSKVKCVAFDTGGDTLAYTWSATGGAFFGAGPVITWVAPSATGRYAITVTVTDSQGREAKNQLTLNVRDNHPPVIESLTAKPRRVIKANTSVLKCVASDADGDELTYRWEVTGGNISGTGTTAIWTAPGIEGSYIIRVIATDSLGSGASKDLAMVVTCGCGSR